VVVFSVEEDIGLALGGGRSLGVGTFGRSCLLVGGGASGRSGGGARGRSVRPAPVGWSDARWGGSVTAVVEKVSVSVLLDVTTEVKGRIAAMRPAFMDEDGGG